MTEPREWRLHVGVHKTATTHLQDTLDRQRAALARAGVSVVPRAASRDVSLGRTLCGIGWRGLLPVAARQRMASTILDRLGCSEPVIVWSEENIVGRPEEMLSAPMFPRLESRLRSLVAATRSARHHLFLSVRDPAEILPAIYAQCLRTGPPGIAFDELRRQWLTSSPRWSDLVARIGAVFPEAPITVWSMEGYTTKPEKILQRVAGTDLARDLDLPPPKGTRRPSARAVGALESLPRSLQGSAWRARADAILAEDRGEPPFDPLTADQRATLGDAYRADLAAMRAAGVEVLADARPESST